MKLTHQEVVSMKGDVLAASSTKVPFGGGARVAVVGRGNEVTVVDLLRNTKGRMEVKRVADVDGGARSIG